MRKPLVTSDLRVFIHYARVELRRSRQYLQRHQLSECRHEQELNLDYALLHINRSDLILERLFPGDKNASGLIDARQDWELRRDEEFAKRMYDI